MRARDLSSTLSSLYETREPVYVGGAPGIGKSSVIKQASQNLGIDFYDFRALLHDPADLKFPVVNQKDKTVTWVCSCFPSDPKWEGIILLDELPNAPALMQAALLQLVLDRSIGTYTLPKGAWVLAAGNRPQDHSGAARLLESLGSRFCRLEFDVSNEDWLAWSLKAGIHEDIRSFIRWRPSALHAFDPKSAGQPQPNPRAWHKVSNIQKKLENSLFTQCVQGLVGGSEGAQYLAFRKIYTELPDIDPFITNPEKVKLPKDPSVLWALTGALLSRLRDEKTPAKCVPILAQRFRDEDAGEIGLLLAKDACELRNELITDEKMDTWITKNRDLMPSAA